jgi:hypothetical protein
VFIQFEQELVAYVQVETLGQEGCSRGVIVDDVGAVGGGVPVKGLQIHRALVAKLIQIAGKENPC